MSSRITFRTIFPIFPKSVVFQGIGGDVIQYELGTTHSKFYLLRRTAVTLFLYLKVFFPNDYLIYQCIIWQSIPVAFVAN